MAINPAFTSGGADIAPVLPGQNLGNATIAGTVNGQTNTGAVITSQNTAPTTPISVTPPPDNTNYQGILDGAKTQAEAIQKQITDMSKVTAPTAPTGQAPQSNPIQDYINSITGVQQPSASQTYQQGYDASGLAGQQADIAAKAQVTQQAQAKLGNISAQLQALQTEAQAIPIQAQQQSEGRGITAGGLAPIQADQLRANALKALPLQAQAVAAQAEVAAAQGNQQLAQDLYTQAQQHFDKIFELQMTDATNKYNFQTGLITKVFEFADKQEQRTLDALKIQQAQDFQTKQADIAYSRQVATDKLKNDQAIALKKMELGTKPPEVKSINGVDSQWNPVTGKWEAIAGGVDNNKDVKQLAQYKSNVDEITNILSDTNLNGVVGPNALARFAPIASLTGAKSNVIAGIEQIRSSLNLKSLIDAKAQGATFGALSDQELQVLANTATKIGSWAIKDSNGNVTGYNASEKDFKAELDKINNFAKLDYIIKGGDPAEIGAIQQADGTYWVKNSDGTYTQLK